MKSFVRKIMFVVIFFIIAGMRVNAAGIICLPECVSIDDGMRVYSDDVVFSVNSDLGGTSNIKAGANNANVEEIENGIYKVTGEGNIRIFTVLEITDEEGNISEECDEEWIIIDKTSPVINISYSDNRDSDGNLIMRTMNFSFDDMTTDYGSLLVIVNNERVNFDIPDNKSVDFSLDFEGEGYFDGYISISDKAGHESIKNIDGFELGVKKKTSDNQPDEKPGKEEHAKSDDTNINTGENNQKRTVQKDEISKGEEDGRIDDKTDENMKTPEKKISESDSEINTIPKEAKEIKETKSPDNPAGNVLEKNDNQAGKEGAERIIAQNKEETVKQTETIVKENENYLAKGQEYKKKQLYKTDFKKSFARISAVAAALFFVCAAGRVVKKK